jgi:hypothetical protein
LVLLLASRFAIAVNFIPLRSIETYNFVDFLAIFS